MSHKRLRYAGKVRQETRRFLARHIGFNYFTGHRRIGLETTLEQAEIMYSANEDMRAQAATGELKSLHEECNSLGDKCEADYLASRDRIENLIQSIKTRENKIYESLRNDHNLERIKLHESQEASLFDVLAYSSEGATIENINHLSSAIDNGSDF